MTAIMPASEWPLTWQSDLAHRPASRCRHGGFAGRSALSTKLPAHHHPHPQHKERLRIIQAVQSLPLACYPAPHSQQKECLRST
jgi:hypothetical protein